MQALVGRKRVEVNAPEPLQAENAPMQSLRNAKEWGLLCQGKEMSEWQRMAVFHCCLKTGPLGIEMGA